MMNAVNWRSFIWIFISCVLLVALIWLYVTSGEANQKCSCKSSTEKTINNIGCQPKQSSKEDTATKADSKKTSRSPLMSIDLKSLSSDDIERYRHEALRFVFAPKMTPKERRLMLETLKVCLDMLEKVGIPYFIYSGTLLGYHRHNGSLIPWDDDADIAMLTQSEDEARSFMAKMEAAIKGYPGYILAYAGDGAHRYKCAGNLTSNSFLIDPWRAWRWPFIDLQFMRQINGTGGKIFTQDYQFHSFKYPLDMVYPPKRAYFSEINIPVFLPKDVPAVLKTTFKVEECRTNSAYNHRRERPVTTTVVVECSVLKDFYNFTNLK